MAGVGIKFEVQGMAPLLARLKAIKESTRNKYLRRALNKAGRIVRKSARDHLRGTKREPQSRIAKALDVKVKVTDKTAYVIIGPKRGYFKQHGLPSNVDYLVEFGHGGPTPAPPHPFMRPAYVQTKSEVENIILDELSQGIASEAEKGNL